MAQDWDEEKLIRLILSGEERQLNAAASAMSRQFWNMVAKIVRIGGGQKEDIESILNDAIMEVIAKVQNGSYDVSIATLKTLLFSIAKNKWLDDLARRYRIKNNERPSTYEHISFKHAHRSSIEEQLFTKEERDKIAWALKQLDPACHTLFTMKYMQGISLRTIAENLGISEDAVKKRHERCKKKLKKIFGQDPRIG